MKIEGMVCEMCVAYVNHTVKECRHKVSGYSLWALLVWRKRMSHLGVVEDTHFVPAIAYSAALLPD